ncbi:MAG: ROK family protein [Rikenellaceae bacterium]
MGNLKDFFSVSSAKSAKGVVHKNNIIKRNIVALMALTGESTLSELTRKLNVSVPTITKLVQELVDEDILTDLGKVETSGGRRPNIFGLASSAIYFVGVSVGRTRLIYLLMDLHNNVVEELSDPDFELVDSAACLEQICSGIERFVDGCGVDRAKIMGVGVSVTGRVNPETGRSYKYFTDMGLSMCEVVEKRVGIRVLLENDTRARCFAEYLCDGPDLLAAGGDVEAPGGSAAERNVLYLHLGLGVAIGIITDGKLYYGKSGFAGEFGHIPLFDNDLICACGKKGCLETEVSGVALERKLRSAIDQGVNTILSGSGSVSVEDIVAAAKRDDNLSIELIAEIGAKVGRAMAYLINIFNPESVVIGGAIAEAGDCIMLPMMAAVNRYSLGLVYKDTQFRLSTMGDSANALGVAMLMRNKILDI